MNTKRNILGLLLAGALLAGGKAHANTIVWGYENWLDAAPADGQVDEWGTYNLNYTPQLFSGETVASAVIGNLASYGKAYYGTGVSASDIQSTYKYLYVETYDVQGDVKLAVSGDSDADFYEAVPHLVSGTTGDPNVIFNPGPYVFDLSGWNPGQNWTNTTFQIIGEGGENNGFKLRRVFLADYNPLAPTDPVEPPVDAAVPEPASLLLLASGLTGLGLLKRRA